MKKESPILMSVSMAKAAEAGLKTNTRRGISNLVIDEGSGFAYYKGKHMLDIHRWQEQLLPFCPYGQPGDLLYVREEHYQYGHWKQEGTTKKGAPKWKFIAMSQEALAFSDQPPGNFLKSRSKTEPAKVQLYKRLARFMPKKLARIWLEITDVKVERLQSISSEDILAEGVLIPNHEGNPIFILGPGNSELSLLKDKPTTEESIRFAYWKDLWCTINGSESWDANPYVWVIKFRKIEKPS